MPLYAFEQVDNPKVKEDIFFTMKECPKVSEIITDDEGVKWRRIFTLPYATIDSRIDHNNSHDFIEKTGKKKGSVGDLWDASRELSDKRAKERGGVDPVKQRHFDNYKKARHGKEHFQEKKERKIDKADYSISHT